MIRSWEVLELQSQLAEAEEISFKKPVVFFKHSVTCGISARSKYMLEADWDFSETDLKFYYLDLLNHRTISNRIADDYGVRHQSPQIIILSKGKVVFDVSHHRISIKVIKKALKSHAEI